MTPNRVFSAGVDGWMICDGSLTCEKQPSHVHGQSAKRLHRSCGNFVLISRKHSKKKKQYARLHSKPNFAFVFFSCKDLFLVRAVFEDRCEKPQFFIIVLSQATFSLLWSLTQPQICGGRRPGRLCSSKRGFQQQNTV